MTERTVTIKIDLQGGVDAGVHLKDLKKQIQDLQGQKIKLNTQASKDALRDLGSLSNAVTSSTIAPLAQYQKLMGGAIQVTKLFGGSALGALKNASAEFQKQKELAQFWGTQGYINRGVDSVGSSLRNFLSSGGKGFTDWIQNGIHGLEQYRTVLAGTAVAFLAFGAAAAMSSKTTANLISSTLDTRLMSRKLTDKGAAEKWIQQAQGDDWSAGRTSRLGVFQTILSKNVRIGQEEAQKRTEDIEKFFFANQEMLKAKGIGSAEDLASRISAPQLSGEDATKFEDLFGLGFSKLLPEARLARLSTESGGIDINKALEKRSDVIMTKRLEATTAKVGDTILPILNKILGGFLKISDVIGQIPGLGQMIGWGTVLTVAAAGGLTLLSVLGGMITNLQVLSNVLRVGKAAQLAMSAATYVAAGAQWALNAAMTANPIGIAIVAVVGLIAILYALEKKFGIVSKAWQMFSGSDIGKGLKDAVSKFMKDPLKVGLDLFAAVSPMGMTVKVALMVADFLKKLWVNSDILNKLIKTGMTIWQKMTDFVNWLLNTIKSMWSWLMNAIPGAKKEQYRQDLQKALGITDKNPSGTFGVTLNSAGKLVANGHEMTREEAEHGFALEGYRFGGLPANILTKYDEYTNAPGFAQGIADAVKQGLTGLTMSVPGMSELAQSVENLIKPLQDLQSAISNVFGNGPGAHTGETPILENDVGSAYANPGGSYDVRLKKSSYGFSAGQLVQGLSTERTQTLLGTTEPLPAPKMDVGGKILVTGPLIGHGGEQIDSAEVVRGGETTLEKINRIVSGTSFGAGQTIIVHAPPVSIHIDKIENQVDVDRLISKLGEEFDDKLLFRLRNKLDNHNTRAIGYLRG